MGGLYHDLEPFVPLGFPWCQSYWRRGDLPISSLSYDTIVRVGFSPVPVTVVDEYSIDGKVCFPMLGQLGRTSVGEGIDVADEPVADTCGFLSGIT